MTLAAIRETILAKPDCPHVISLDNGRDLQVPHPDFVFFPAPQSAETDWFIVQKPEGGFTVVSVDSVSAINVALPSPAQR